MLRTSVAIALVAGAAACTGSSHETGIDAAAPDVCEDLSDLSIVPIASSSPMAGWVNALALDDDCVPHVAYLTEADSDATVWTAQVRDGLADAEQVTEIGDHAHGRNISLAIDSEGRRHLVFGDDANGSGSVGYAIDDGGWAIDTVDSGSGDQGLGYKTSMALAPDGTVHMAWEGGYAAGTFDDFYTQDFDGGSYFALTVDGDGKPLIVDQTDDDRVRVNLFDGTTWSTLAEVDGDDGAYVGLYPDIAEQDGVIHLAYSAFESGDAVEPRYATNEGGAWVVDVLEHGDHVGHAPKLAVGDDGTVHLAYADIANDLLRYGVREPGGDWVLQDVTGLGDSCGTPGLELDWDQLNGTADIAVMESSVFVSYFSHGALCLASFPVGWAP